MPLFLLRQSPVLLLLLTVVACGLCEAAVVVTEVAEVMEASGEMEETVATRRQERMREGRSFRWARRMHCRICRPLDVVARLIDDRVGISEHTHRNGIGCPLAL